MLNKEVENVIRTTIHIEIQEIQISVEVKVGKVLRNLDSPTCVSTKVLVRASEEMVENEVLKVF